MGFDSSALEFFPVISRGRTHSRIGPLPGTIGGMLPPIISDVLHKGTMLAPAVLFVWWVYFALPGKVRALKRRRAEIQAGIRGNSTS